MLGLVALSIAFGSLTIVGAQQRPPIVGGYKAVEADNLEVVAAAEFAVGAQEKKLESEVKLVSVEHAERQVVAGMNYRLCLKVEIEDKENNTEVRQEVKVVIFRSLKNEYSLKSWEEEECGESESTSALVDWLKYPARKY
ncbi:MAG: hypothetical protein QOF02_4031 [Blastocatellia bacterium]|jgi:hypothetical protein|nr:hypothetical protein [Blastocatellia bacterium]